MGPSERLGAPAIGHPLRSGPVRAVPSARGPPSPSPWLAGKALESPRIALLAFPGTPKVGATPLARGFLPRPPPYPHPRGDGEKGKLCPTPGLREQVCDLNKDLVSKNITKKKKKDSIPPERSSTKRTCEQKHPAEIDCQFMHPQRARSSSWGNQGRNGGGGGGMSRGWGEMFWVLAVMCELPQPSTSSALCNSRSGVFLCL